MEEAAACLTVLRDELRHAERRLAKASEEGRPVVLAQIREIRRDIVRYSVISRDRHEIEEHRTA